MKRLLMAMTSVLCIARMGMAADTYSVLFDANGGTGVMAEQSLTNNMPQALSSNLFTKAGFMFDGWATTENGERDYFDNEEVVNLTDEKTISLYARWQKVEYKIIEAETELGTISMPYAVNGKLNYADLDKFGLHQYALFYAQSSMTGRVVYSALEGSVGISSVEIEKSSGDSWVLVGSGSMVYEKASEVYFEKGVKYRLVIRSDDLESGTALYQIKIGCRQVGVYFNPNGGNMAVSKRTRTYSVGEQYESLPIIYKSSGSDTIGMLGWYTATNGGKRITSDGIVSATITNLYAQWPKDPYGYFVAFEPNGGVGNMDTQQVESSGKDFTLNKNTFTRYGYAFDHWLSEDGTEYEDEAVIKANYPLADDKGKTAVLTAMWKLLPTTYTTNGVTWTYQADANGYATIVSNELWGASINTNAIGDIVVPTTIGESNYIVIAISDFAFNNCSNITSVTIPYGIDITGINVFDGCTSITNLNLEVLKPLSELMPDSYMNITSVSVPSGAVEIIEAAFSNCVMLLDVEIPNTVEAVGDNAFFNTAFWWKSGPVVYLQAGGDCETSELFLLGVTDTNAIPEYLVISNRVKSISGGAFRDCSNLKQIVFPDSLTSIGDYGFYNTGLTNVIIPILVSSIGDYSFAECLCLQKASYSTSMTIGYRAFYHTALVDNVILDDGDTLKDSYPNSYDSITSVRISDSATNIAACAFAGCTNLVEVHVPDGIVGIGTNAFQDCVSITEITLPKSLTTIATNAFAGCTGITSVNMPMIMALRIAFPDSYANIVKVDVPQDSEDFLDSATEICSGAFEKCTSLTEISLPLGVEELPEDVFNGCTSLENIIIPYTVTTIGARAFKGCTGLTLLTVTENVTSIGDGAFTDCANLKAVHYLGDEPDASSGQEENIYYHSNTNLISGYLKIRKWESAENTTGDGTEDTGNSYTKWPSGNAGRRLVLWNTSNYKFTKVTFNYNDGGKNPSDEVIYVLSGDGQTRVLGNGMPDSENGWWTERYGGTQVDEYTEVTGPVTYYSHYTDESAGGGEQKEWSGTDPMYDSDGDFAYSAATFDAYLMNDDTIAGGATIVVKKGSYNKTEEASNSTCKVTMTFLGSSTKVAISGTIDGEGNVLVEKEGKYSLDLAFTQFGVTGNYSDESSGNSYSIVGARDRYSANSDDAKYAVRSALANARGTWNIVLGSVASSSDLGGEAFANGYSVLSATIASKGIAKITGVMADGSKVAASSKLIVGDGCACLPVAVPLYSKKGGFAFAIWFTWSLDMEIGRDPSIFGLSEWDASKNRSAPFTATFEENEIYALDSGISQTAAFALGGDFSIEGVTIADDLLPSGTEITMTPTRWTLPKADKVKFVKDEGAWVDQSDDPVNPAALKLTYTAKTGLFKGSFKVYGVTDAGKSKTYTATVNGAFVNGDDEYAGYGSAYIKKVGTVPITIEVE